MNTGTFGGLSPFNIHRKLVAYIYIALYPTHHGKRLHESRQSPVSVLAIFHTCHPCVAAHPSKSCSLTDCYWCRSNVYIVFVPLSQAPVPRSACVAWFLLLTVGACLLLASIDTLLMLRGTKQYLQLSFINLLISIFCQCMSYTAGVWRLQPSSSRSCFFSLG